MNNWQRLEQVIKWTGLSTNAFAKVIGLKRSENLYQIKRGSFGISKELARLITTKYTIVNRAWLLTGEGKMLKMSASDNESEMMNNLIKGLIPYYPIDIVSFASNVFPTKPTHNLVLPMFIGATFATTCVGNAMRPSVPNGSIVVLRDSSVNSIVPGETYLIATNDFVLIRTIRTIDSNENKIMLVADNREQYDNIILEKTEINKIYIVLGVIINKQS